MDWKATNNTQLHSVIAELKNDSNLKLAEVAENVDFELLKARKKVTLELERLEKECNERF